MWNAVANSMRLWGWTLFELLPVSVGERLMPRYNKEYWFCSDLILEALTWKLEKWRILPTGCELPDDVCQSHMESYVADRKESARWAAEEPFSIPPVAEEHRAEVEGYERMSRKHAVECVDEDIAEEEARIEAFRHFDKKMWRSLTTRLWHMSAHGCNLDRFLFRPGKRGRGRTVIFVISGTEYLLHLDFSEDAVEGRFEFIKEHPQSEECPIDEKHMRVHP